MRPLDAEEILTEVPLIFPCHFDSPPRRFIINDLNKSATETSPGVTVDSVNGGSISERLRGSASVSFLGTDGKDVVSTSALPDIPNILSVNSMRCDGRSTKVELDLGREMTNFLYPITVQSFDSETDGIRLVLVDPEGNILIVELESSSLVPTSVNFVSVPKLMEFHVSNYASAGAVLHHNTVLFLSSSVVLLGISPYLLTVDLSDIEEMAKERIFLWSELECVERMKARESTMTYALSRAGDILLGRMDDDGLVDMAPAAAMCSAQNDKTIFTLHADGNLRIWEVAPHPQSMLVPHSVRSLVSQNDHGALPFPDPSTWSHATDAATLCANIYETGYAVAAHVQTHGVDSFISGSSNCTLLVLHGSPDDTDLDMAPVNACLTLDVPKDATSLVDMQFVSNSPQCALRALFRSSLQSPIDTIVTLYPPSLTSIISTLPEVIHPEHTLEGVGELERVRSPSFTPVKKEYSSVEDAVHDLDRTYLNFMFRPWYPRGSGFAGPPSRAVLFKVLGKLVPGSVDPNDSISTELGVLRSMNAWSKTDSKKEIALVPAGAAIPNSIYHSFVAKQKVDAAPEEKENTTDDQDLLSRRKRQWKTLLSAVWEEERLLRTPLCLSLPQKESVSSGRATEFVLVRAGVTSAFVSSKPIISLLDEFAEFDQAAMSLLAHVDAVDELRLARSDLENKLRDIVSRATLVASYPINKSQMQTDLRSLARRAISGSPDHTKIARKISQCYPSKVNDWLEREPDERVSCSMPGLSIFSMAEEPKEPVDQVCHTDSLFAAASASLRYVESLKQLRLGRCLLVMMNNEQSQMETSIRTLLHSLAVQWACSQHVPIASASSSDARDGSRSPPLSRARIPIPPAMLLSGRARRSAAVDVYLSHLLASEGSSISSFVGTALSVMNAFVKNSFYRTYGALNEKKTYQTLRELGALPPPQGSNGFTDFPRLALRLLAPFVAFPPLEASSKETRARREMAAECLLIECDVLAKTNKSISRHLHSAFNVLSIEESNDSVDVEGIALTLSALVGDAALETNNHSHTANKDQLATLLTHILAREKNGEHDETILSLTKLPTVQSLFSPWVAKSGGGDLLDFMVNNLSTRGLAEPFSCLQSLVSVLLRLSNAMRKIIILEKHMTTDPASVDVIVQAAKEAIAIIETDFPKQFYTSIPEYAKLWASIFRHATTGKDWSKAYESCLKHPCKDRMINNYKRLVTSMAEAGEFRAFLKLSRSLFRIGDRMEVDGNENDGVEIDLLELAAETLTEASYEQARRGSLYSSNALPTVDYRSCLYALHASSGKWRRAAQALDLRFITACASPDTSEQSPSLRINDICLSSLGAALSLRLVKPKGKRYLVSGETGPFPDIYQGETDEGGSDKSWIQLANKRNRQGQPTEEEPTADFSNSSSRLARFMTVTKLTKRAVRSMALRTLFMDKSTSVDIAILQNFINAESVDSDREIIDNLAKLGYYHLAYVMAKLIDATMLEEKGSSRPGGRDVLHDSISHILCRHLVPATIGLMRKTGASSGEVYSSKRPTMWQLESTLSATPQNGKLQTSCLLHKSWKGRADLVNSIRGSACMDVLRKMTLARASAFTPTALEVAEALLDMDEYAVDIPTWLKEALVGIHVPSLDGKQGQAPAPTGMFAPVRRGAERSGLEAANPCGLLKLYMKKGLLEQACDLVSLVLSSANHQGSSAVPAVSRLPEKGQIDFVPYNLIDMLWNMIESIEKSNPMNASTFEARTRMEEAMLQHFDRMKLNEAGLRSARALGK